MSQSSSAAIRVPVRPVARPLVRPQAPRLRVVAPVRRRSAGGLALLSVTLLGFGLLVLLLLNISIGKGAYALTELQRQQRDLAETKQALAEQVQQVSAPQELAAKARHLGMVPAPNPAFVDVPDGRVQGQPETATAPVKPVKPAGSASSGATKSGTAKSGTAKSGTAKSGTTSGTAKSGTAKSGTAKSGTTSGTAKSGTAGSGSTRSTESTESTEPTP
jgi:hypothetical protein